MVKKLVSRIEFARLAKVTPGAVTKACGTIIKAALVGRRIDAAHPAARDYLKNRMQERRKKSKPSPASGLDSLYEEAVKVCTTTGRWSTTVLRQKLHIGDARAKRILATMRATGLVPATGKSPSPPKKKKTKTKTKTASEVELPSPPSDDDDDLDMQIFDIPDDIQEFADMTLREIFDKFGTQTRFKDWLKATKEIEMINEKRLKNAATKGELVSRQIIKAGIIDPIDAVHIQLLTDGAKTIARRVTAMHDAGQSLEKIETFIKDQITSFIRPVKAKVARALRDA